MSVATLGVMAAAFFSGSAVTRNPTFLAFPMMMLVSMAVTAMAAAAGNGDAVSDDDRVDYLGYLSRLRQTVTETAAAQRISLDWSHPDPDTLWTLIGGPRMWERRANDADFCLARVGPWGPAPGRAVGATGDRGRGALGPRHRSWLHRFIRTHAAIAAAPITIGLREIDFVVIDGEVDAARGLLRAMICQLAVLHPPDQLLIAGVISLSRRAHWDWLKWLPHNQHPTATDSVGSVRMVYHSPTEMHSVLGGAGLPYLVVIADLDEQAEFRTAAAITHMTVSNRCRGFVPHAHIWR